MVNSVIVDNLTARYNPSLLISCSALTKSRYIEAYLAMNTNKTTYISIQCNIYVWSVFKQIDMCELCSPVFTQAAFIQSPTHRFRAEIRVSVIQRLQKISTPKLHSTCLRTGMNIHSSRYSENSQAQAALQLISMAVYISVLDKNHSFNHLFIFELHQEFFGGQLEEWFHTKPSVAQQLLLG